MPASSCERRARLWFTGLLKFLTVHLTGKKCKITNVNAGANGFTAKNPWRGVPPFLMLILLLILSLSHSTLNSQLLPPPYATLGNPCGKQRTSQKSLRALNPIPLSFSKGLTLV